MKSCCQYTGLVVSDQPGFLKGFYVDSVHPLFHADTHKLVKLANLMTQPDRLDGYTDSELLLVTLACLHSLNRECKNLMFIQTKTIRQVQNQERGACRSILFNYPVILSLLSYHSPEWIEKNMPAFNINAKQMHTESYKQQDFPFIFAASWFDAIKVSNDTYKADRQEASKHDAKMTRYASSNNRIATIKSTMLNGTFEARTKSICSYLKMFGELPETVIPDPFSGNKTTIKEYWLNIIKADDFVLVGIPENDISELEDHLIDNLPVDEFSSYVMEFLRELKQRVSINRLPFAIADFLSAKEDESNFGVLETGTKQAKKTASIDELLAKAVAEKQAKQANKALQVAPGFSLNNFFANRSNKDENEQ